MPRPFASLTGTGRTLVLAALVLAAMLLTGIGPALGLTGRADAATVHHSSHRRAAISQVWVRHALRAGHHGTAVSVSAELGASTRARMDAGVCSHRAGGQWRPFVVRDGVALHRSGIIVAGTRRVDPGRYGYRACVRRHGALRLLGPLRALTVTAAVAAGATAPSTPAAPAPPAGAVTPEQYGAAGNGTTDDQAALQRALDAVPAGGTLWLSPGRTYAHSGVLQARVPGETVAGTGTLLATAQATSSFWITADDVTVDGPTFDLASSTQRWDAFEQMGVRVAGVANTVLRNITVDHSAAAGIYVGQSCCTGPTTRSSNFLIDNVTVENTRADGIHMTGGSHDGVVRDVTTSNTGDDGVAVVSYAADGAVCNHIQVVHPTVLSTAWGRGLSVVGGQYVTFTEVDVANTDAAGIYIANEGAPFYTASSSHVTVTGGTITHANTDANVGHGAVLVWSGQTGHSVDNVAISGLTIRNTPTTAPWQVAVRTDAGAVFGVTVTGIDVTGADTPFVTNLGAAAVSATDWTVNGTAATRV